MGILNTIKYNKKQINKNKIKLKKTQTKWEYLRITTISQKTTCFGNYLFHNISFIIQKFRSILYSSTDFSTDHPF